MKASVVLGTKPPLPLSITPSRTTLTYLSSVLVGVPFLIAFRIPASYRSPPFFHSNRKFKPIPLYLKLLPNEEIKSGKAFPTTTFSSVLMTGKPLASMYRSPFSYLHLYPYRLPILSPALTSEVIPVNPESAKTTDSMSSGISNTFPSLVDQFRMTSHLMSWFLMMSALNKNS